MTFTYTSADLAQIAAIIPNQASAAGLAIIPGVEIIRETDVRIYPFEAEIGDALRVAVLANASDHEIGQCSGCYQKILSCV